MVINIKLLIAKENMIKLKENNKREQAKRVMRTFTLKASVIKRLNDELKEAGYENGVSDINFSNLLSDLIEEFADKLNSENKEDEE